MMLREMIFSNEGKILCGQSVTFLRMLCYLVGLQKENLLALVVTMAIIFTIIKQVKYNEKIFKNMMSTQFT